jgi:hypothetical protein
MPILILVVGPISAISIVIRRKRSIDSAPNILFNLRIIEKYPHIKSMMLFMSFPMRYRTPIAVDESGGRGRGASGSHGQDGVEHWIFSQLRTWGVNSELPAWKKGREPQPRGFRNLAFETSKLALELSAWKHGLSN